MQTITIDGVQIPTEVAEKIISEMHDDLCVIWGISNEKK